jgi:Alpha-L-arabinofuranosidase B (ABFB) domain
MSFFEFRAINFPDHFIRHRNFLGELTRKDDLAGDFQFALVRRGDGLVSFRSKNFPNLFLRHRDFRIRLEGPAGPNDQLFLRDSTFALDATFVKQPAAVLID